VNGNSFKGASELSEYIDYKRGPPCKGKAKGGKGGSLERWNGRRREEKRGKSP